MHTMLRFLCECPGFELRSSHLCSKHFADRAKSQPSVMGILVLGKALDLEDESFTTGCTGFQAKIPKDAEVKF